MKKGILLVGCALIGAALVWFFWLSPSPTKQAHQFLTLIAAGQIDEAYALSTPELRMIASKGELLVKSRRLGLDQYSGADWSECNFPHPDTADLTGLISLRDGGSIHLHMRMRRDESTWRVDFLGKTKGDLVMPDEDRLRQMITDTMLNLGQSINDGDFAEFRSKCARSLKMMNTEEELQRSFARIDYSFVKELSPRFTQDPSIDAQGDVSLLGHYDTSPSRMEFLMKFTHEAPNWRLTTLQIHLVDVYESQAEQFVRLLAKNQLQSAYDLTSMGFRENANKQQLQTVADQLQLDQNATPRWTDQDAADSVVTLDGNMPTRHGRNVRLRVGMILEDGDWKVHYLR